MYFPLSAIPSAEVYKNDNEEKYKVTFEIFRAANINLNQWKYYIIKKMSIFLMTILY
jgi:hypothetical protein